MSLSTTTLVLVQLVSVSLFNVVAVLMLACICPDVLLNVSLRADIYVLTHNRSCPHEGVHVVLTPYTRMS